MKMSEQINEIAKAMSKAQQNMKPAEKDSINPHFKSKHSSMCAVWDAASPIMQEGICILQDAVTTDRGISVETTLIHESGQWFQFGPLVLPLAKVDPQACGSAISYCKRYALCAAVGIVSSDVDDDGEAAMQRNVNKGTGEIKVEDKASPEQIHKLVHLLKITEEERNNICKFNNISDIAGLTVLQATKAISSIERKREKESV
jgi:hypothetical protein